MTEDRLEKAARRTEALRRLVTNIVWLAIVLEHIVRDVASLYVHRLREQLDQVPERYRIPHQDWERYLEGIALTTGSVEGNRETQLTLKELTASGAGGTVLLASNLKMLVGKLGSKVMASTFDDFARQTAAVHSSRAAAGN